MNTKLAKAKGALATCLLALSCIRADADVAAQIQSVTNLPASGEYVCAQRSPNSRIWQRAELETNESGVVRTNLHSYTELATGLCYLENGQYVDSVEQINIAGDGAEAAQGPCQVQWAADASTAGGAVQLTSPTGQQFTSRVFGLALRDTSTGSNVLIAEITNSTGILVGQNQVLYPSAFSGLQADIQDIYRKSGFEQNVVLREQPPSPADYGLNPETTRLEVLTEFFNPPVPTKTTVQTDGESDDLKLDFGDLHIGRGTAFLTSGQTNLSRLKVNVSKRWETLDDGRVFLIEEVPLPAMTNLLQTLPPHASTGKPSAKIRRTASLKSLLRAGNATPKHSGVMKVAQGMPRRPGVVIDYMTVSGADTSYIFQGDTTYYLSGGFEIDDPGPVIFEGGSVIKIPGTNGGIDNMSSAPGIFNGSSYRPVVFTSSDDNSVGESIGSGSPSEGGGCYFIQDMPLYGDPVTIANVRFSYAGTVYDDGSGSAGRIFKDCQFVKCGLVMYLGGADFVSFENVLCAHCDSFIEVMGSPVDAENITVDSCGWFASGVMGGSGITNSILTGCDSSITDFHLDHTVVASNGTGIYQTVGAASYYLANGSTNRNAGTTNIDTNLLADLRTKTTHPPMLMGSNISYALTNDYTFFPQAQRDTNGSTVDRGYHYDPIDYAVSLFVSNATMTVLPGTALAMAGSVYGIEAYIGANLQFPGTATEPINIFRYNCVQEQSNTNWFYSTWQENLYVTGNPATLNFRFVNWSALAYTALFKLHSPPEMYPIPFYGCQFYNGWMEAHAPDLLVTNCLFQRIAFGIQDGGITNHHNFYNNLFEGGSITMDNEDGGTWTFSDNLFDQTAISQSDVVVADYNGFVSGCDRLSPYGSNDVVLDSSPAYQPGTLGGYYYPASLPLIHAGSRSAAMAGLYHYTVTANNVIEGTNRVSIGYHYVATYTNGAPLDTGGGGIPDYIADSNGDGVYDAGDISNWQTNMTCSGGLTDYIMYIQGRSFTACASVPDTNGLVDLQVYTPLK